MNSRWLIHIAGALLAVVVLLTLPAMADSARLATGDVLPLIEADSVAGTHVALPIDQRGTPFVVIFGFSQKGGEASAQWSHALRKFIPNDVAIYAIADISRVPGLFRGFAIAGIRHEALLARPEERAQILLLKHGNIWSQIVPSGSDDDAVIIAVDKTGTVTEIERRAFGDIAAIDIAKTIINRP